MKKTAIGLFSGGLDSCLAVKLMLEQGFRTICLSFDLWKYPKEEDSFHPLKPKAEMLGAEFMSIDLSDEYPDLIYHPRWGYGSVINPCIDCKLLMLRKAAEVMKRENADLVFTGEVLGQRPMTQTKTIMKMLEKQSGLKGKLLRPLCAKLLTPTIPEQDGIVDREKLMNIQGRGRNRQIEMAEKYGLEDYPSPAGGCVLTQKEYGGKAADMMIYAGKPLNVEALELLKTGRHFRISPDAKLVVGRNEKENDILEGFRKGRIALQPADTLGPLALIDGKPSDSDIDIALRITARYTKEKRSQSVRLILMKNSGSMVFDIKPISDAEMETFRINFDKKKIHRFYIEHCPEKDLEGQRTEK